MLLSAWYQDSIDCIQMWIPTWATGWWSDSHGYLTADSQDVCGFSLGTSASSLSPKRILNYAEVWVLMIVGICDKLATFPGCTSCMPSPWDNLKHTNPRAQSPWIENTWKPSQPEQGTYTPKPDPLSFSSIYLTFPSPFSFRKWLWISRRPAWKWTSTTDCLRRTVAAATFSSLTSWETPIPSSVQINQRSGQTTDHCACQYRFKTPWQPWTVGIGLLRRLANLSKMDFRKSNGELANYKIKMLKGSYSWQIPELIN